MASLYVTEFADVSMANGRLAQIVNVPPIAEQVVTYTTTTQSAAFNAATRYVRIHTDANCSIAFGTNPTATTSTMRLVTGQTEYFAVPNNVSFKVAAVTN